MIVCSRNSFHKLTVPRQRSKPAFLKHLWVTDPWYTQRKFVSQEETLQQIFEIKF